MDYQEFRRQLGKAGLTNKAFAELVKVNSNTLSNYKKTGTVPSQWAIVVFLMALLAENRIDFKTEMKSLDIKPNKVRGSSAKGQFGGDRQALLFEQMDY